MDLWDMTKLLFRRWYFSAPLLLLTVALVGVASVKVKPDYDAIGHVQLIPPVGTTAKDGEKNPIRNQWFDLGYEALGNATAIDVTKKTVLETMLADGLSDNITINVDLIPLFEIEAVGSSPEQAQATVKRVQQNIGDAVALRQTALRVPKTDTITTLTLDDGSEITTKKSKTTRVMVVAAGLGLLLTAGITIGLDVLLRWRAGRRRRGEPDSDAGAVVGSAHSNGQVPSSFESTHVVVPRTNGTPGRPAPVVQTSDGKNGAATPLRARGGGDGGTEYRSKQAPDADDQGPSANAPDATIVLPRPTWKRDEKADQH